MTTPSQDLPEPDRAGLTTRQKQLVGFIVVLAVVNVLYRLVYATGLARTAALYVGVPAALAIGLAMLPRKGSTIGSLFKGSTITLLIAAVVLPEGLLCLLFVLPLVLGACVVVGGVMDISRRRRHRRQGPTLMVVSLPLLVLSLEGVAGSPFDAHDAGKATIEVSATPAEVEAAIAGTPRFDSDLPLFLSLGFNRPVGATGSGIAVGDERTIEFTGGSHDDHPLRLFGLTGERSVDHHATMRLRVVESAPGRVVFDIEEDTTMVSRWAGLERAVVTWAPADRGRGTTRVSWQLEYERLLSPAFYFAPLQGFAADEASGYLLTAVVEEQLR